MIFFAAHKTTLNDYCIAPDEDGDVDKGVGLHYYNVRDSNGNKYEKSSIGAYY